MGTPVRLIVMVLPLNVGLPMTLPALTMAVPSVTTLLNVTTIFWSPLRHSTPGVPVNGSGTSKSPTPPWVLRETALTACGASKQRPLMLEL